ncbi:hypothetical protein ACFX2I_017978 [Malus domestica]
MNPTSSFARPPGRDKHKEAKWKRKSQYPISEQIATGFARLTESHSSREEEAAQIRVAMTQLGDREQERFEINLMMEDLNKYTLERKKCLRGKQREILQRDARRSIFQDDNSCQGYIPNPPPSPLPNQDGGYYY